MPFFHAKKTTFEFVEINIINILCLLYIVTKLCPFVVFISSGNYLIYLYNF